MTNRGRRRGWPTLAATFGLVAALAGLVYSRRLHDRTRPSAPSGPVRDAVRRIAPGVLFYEVRYAGRQIGYASSTIDTAGGGIRATDYLVADFPIGGSVHRVTAHTVARLTRELALRDFALSFDADSAPFALSAHVVADSLLELVVSDREGGGGVGDTTRVRLASPIVPPTLVPAAAVLGATTADGRATADAGTRVSHVATFDPLAQAARTVTLDVGPDSARAIPATPRVDRGTGVWRAAATTTVRASNVRLGGGLAIGGWVDAQGRIVGLVHPAGFELRRAPYELAFENWRRRAAPAGSRVPASRDILETSAIAADARVGGRQLDRLRVRLRRINVGQYDLAGAQQTLTSDTLTIVRAAGATLHAAYALPGDRSFRAQFATELSAEPLVQTADPAIVALARRIAGQAADPRLAAERIQRWVHDSIANSIAVTVPSAIQVLRARRGDCNEHTQLFLALARAVGIPARGVAGLAYIEGKFYYHSWPEVYLGAWVPVDPSLGQFPADAGHVRFVIGGIAREPELLGLIGRLDIRVLEAD